MNEDDIQKANECFEERTGVKVPRPRKSTQPAGQAPSEDEQPSGGTGQAESNGELPAGVPLWEYGDHPPKIEDNLFGDRYICRKGMALLVGPSGQGKSSLILQSSIHWAAGRPFLGIRPARPLKIAIFGCEDDDGDLYEIIRDARLHLGFTDEETSLAITNCQYYHHTKTSGFEFLNLVERILERDQVELVVINPMNAYVGGDVADPAVSGPWLRNTLMPILDRRNTTAWIIHHPPKITNRQSDKWKAGSDWQYSGAGVADITNAMRAILILDPTARFGTFRLIAAKRGRRLGWVDNQGHPQLERYVSWDKTAIWWRPASDQEIREAESKKVMVTVEDVFELVPEDSLIAKPALINQANGLPLGLNKARSFVNELVANSRLFEHKVKRPGTNPAIYLGVFPPTEDLAESQP